MAGEGAPRLLAASGASCDWPGSLEEADVAACAGDGWVLVRNGTRLCHGKTGIGRASTSEMTAKHEKNAVFKPYRT